MQEPERTSVMDWLWPVAVLLVAFGARSWYLFEFTDSGRTEPVLRVQEDRSEEVTSQLELLREHKDYFALAPWSNGPERSAHEAPGYLFFVFGLQQTPLDMKQLVRWTQCVLGTLTALVYYFLARSLVRGHAVA